MLAKKSYTIAIVVDRYWPSRGGVEQATLALAASLPSDWGVTIITHPPSASRSLFGRYTSTAKIPLTDPSGNHIEALTAGRRGLILLLPLLIWNLPFVRSVFAHSLFDILYFWYNAAFSRKLSGFLDNVDSVHCISTGYLARCVTDICLARGNRLIHEPFIHFGRWGDSPAQIRSYASADTVICPTASFREIFLAELDNKESVHVAIVPPVIVEPHYPKLRMPPVPGRFILFLGRRESHKGLASLLVAFSGLEHMASLVIAGPGEKVHIRNMAVFDLGEVDDMVKNWLLSSCDVLCVPSTDESFGMVFAEAMSFGKPVVGFDVEPINEIVENHRTGILVPPDDTDGLHEALATVLDNSHLRKNLGAAAKERYEHRFASRVVIKKIVDLHKKESGTSG